MALPQEFEVYGAAPAQGSRRTSRLMRLGFVAGAIVLAMMCALAFLAGDESVDNSAIEDMVVTPEQKLNSLVSNLAMKGDTMSLSEMEERLDAWRRNPNTILDLPQKARTQMLADMDSSMMFHTTSLADDSTLCAKKDIIIAKFDQLLKKLGGEELALNMSNGALNSQYQAALSAWLDSESSFRLTVEKAKEADDGAAYAREQYEKYKVAYSDAKKTHDAIEAQNAAERNDLLDERELIKEIMRMIGILHDVNATEKSIAAGGRNSVKNEYGVSDPYAIKKAYRAPSLLQKIRTLEGLSLRSRSPRMGQMLRQLKSSLAVYDETEEVARILKQMLLDIEDRLRVLDNLSAGSKKTKDELESKLIEWQTKLVELSNAKDKAKAQAQAEALQRDSLSGARKAAGEEVSQENAAYKLLITPYMKEIYIIQLIKKKIVDHCLEVAAGAAK